MKKYIVPTIKIEKIELTEMIAASPNYNTNNPNGSQYPSNGGTVGKPDNGSTGNVKRFDAWDSWEE